MKLTGKARFVSLRWRFIAALIVVLLGFATVVTLVGVQRFERHIEHDLAAQMQAIWRDYEIQVDVIERRLVSVGQEINLSLASATSVTNEDLNFALGARWDDLEQLWDLQGLVLFDDEYQPIVRLGSDIADLDTLLLFGSVDQVSQSRIRCDNECFVDVLVPLLIDGGAYVVVITSGLASAIAAVVEHHQIELAFLVDEPGSGPWGRQLVSLTHEQANMPLLNRLSSKVTLHSLTQSPTQIRIADQPWVAHTWVLSDTGETMLAFRNIRSLLASERDYVIDVMIMLMIAVTLSLLLTSAVFWYPLQRLRRLSFLLSLLGQGRFADLRKSISPQQQRFVNELDRLEMRTLEAANMLEQQAGDLSRVNSELQRQAMMDLLTGLPNRALFQHELIQVLASVGRTDEQIALMCVDLDEFKRVNDTLGHDIGDELLKTIANRLRKSIRAMDVLCRLSGDEFAIIVRGVSAESDIHRIIHQIFTSLQQPVQLGRHKLIVMASIGVVFCDNPMIRPEELLKRADLALYQAKQAGRSNYRVFNEQMLESASRLMQLEQELRIAIEDHQLSVVMQPILSLKKQRLEGLELLLRWFHPTRGVVMPAEFIGEIEDKQESIEIGYVVLNKAMDYLAQFTAELGTDEFYISVNLSPSQYLHPKLVPFIDAAMRAKPLAPNRLMLEVTEESLIKNLDLSLKTMVSLKQMGVQIAIDDFGTGYSSLSYLKQLPFDALKVDRGFVAELDSSDVDRNIVSNVIELAHNLHRSVIAEGVESHDQRQFLEKIDCDSAQGFLFSSPLEPHQALQLMQHLGSDLSWNGDEPGLPIQSRRYSR